MLFDNIKGYPKGFRVIVNAVCSAATTGLAFGSGPSCWHGHDQGLERKAGLEPLKPVDVANGPITEHVESGDKADMLKFPTPRWHEDDGGRYIGTGCLVILNILGAI